MTTEGGGGYPAGWEADVVVADGGIVHLRPIRPDDADGLVALNARASERTRYLRFFAPQREIPAAQLRRFVNVDYDGRVAFVVELGGVVVAVARYELLSADPSDERVAEVAFLVEDAHQGRGIGTVLLEHLAAAGRERGIARFVADVLPENGRMARVFIDAGFRLTRRYEEGLLHLEFPIAQTDTSVAVAYERAERAEARSLARLLTARSVAVVGASNTPGKVGHVVLHNLAAFRGDGAPRVYPVHPTAPEVQGLPAYRSVADVPDDVDLAVLAVPADAVRDVVADCGRKGVFGLVVVSSGFGERGEDGAVAERELVELARRHGMRVVGPNALGVVNTDPSVCLNATLSTTPPPAGPLGFFCQSGALGVAILADARSRGLGVSTFVSAGNRADVSGNDLLQYWASDSRTEVVLLHLETFGNPRKFARLARRLARTKPVVAVKSGRYAGVKPALARRGAAMAEESLEAMFRSAGIIRVETLSQLFDVGQLLAYQPLPAGPRVGVVGNSSALAVLVADACLANGLTPVDDAIVDIGAEGTPGEFEAALAASYANERVDALVAVFVPALQTEGTEYARVLAGMGEGAKPIVSTFLGVSGVPEPLRRLVDGEVRRGSVPSYPSPERAVLALARVEEYARWRERPMGVVPELPGVDPRRAASLVDDMLRGERTGRELTAGETGELLGAFGVTVDGGSSEAGVDVEIGVVDDPSFGAVVSFGIAGVASELFADRAYRPLPLTDRDAAELVREPRAYPLLTGYGGDPAADVAAVEDLLLRVARLADAGPELLDLHLAVRAAA
ncbi:MAG: GNAT family N-acetyltransferase, partial [Streptosporangiales bacterium]|nr:GNAT family N-acetyltransferase [Streptosporangiales bacterium]